MLSSHDDGKIQDGYVRMGAEGLLVGTEGSILTQHYVYLSVI
jgi:hypothetical protein